MIFETVVQAESSGIMLAVPADAVAALGPKKRPAVKATLNDYCYRTTLSVYGGRAFLPVRREVRVAAGLRTGETVRVHLELDEEPRTVEVPDDLAQALADNGDAQAAFNRLSFTHRKEYVVWITAARRPETRTARIARTIVMLRDGRRTPDSTA